MVLDQAGEGGGGLGGLHVVEGEKMLLGWGWCGLSGREEEEGRGEGLGVALYVVVNEEG